MPLLFQTRTPLYALNRDFEQAWANMELIETLQPLEQDDWTHFSRLHNDTLNKAKRFLAKRREAASEDV